MKVLLVAKFSEVEPLGIMYLSSSLKQHDHKVNICLYQSDPFLEAMPIIYKFKPDIVGYSVYTGNHIKVYEACEKLNGLDVKTVIGGPHTTYFHEDCRRYADYVFRGETLQSFPTALISFPSVDDQKLYPLVDPDYIPFPDRELFYQMSPFHKENRIKNIMTSFGCPFSCHYCYNSIYKSMYENYRVRTRSVDNIIDEAKLIKADLIFFQDDCFGINMNWLDEFTSKWSGRPYHCQMRFEMATDDRLELLKKSGCTGVTCAIECANSQVREHLLNRNVTDEQIAEGALRIKHYGLKLRTEQMLGIPETDLEDELKLLHWNVLIKPDIAWASIFQPYRGTVLGEYCVKVNLYQGDNNDISETFFNESILNYSDQRKAEIKTLQEIFSMCAYLPDGHKLARSIINGGSMIEDVKSHLYGVLYG